MNKRKPTESEPMEMNSSTPPSRPDGRLNKEIQRDIGRRLRDMYKAVVDEGVPDHLADLVRRAGDRIDQASSPPPDSKLDAKGEKDPRP